jgi:hypothetical protein
MRLARLWFPATSRCPVRARACHTGSRRGPSPRCHAACPGVSPSRARDRRGRHGARDVGIAIRCVPAEKPTRRPNTVDGARPEARPRDLATSLAGAIAIALLFSAPALAAHAASPLTWSARAHRSSASLQREPCARRRLVSVGVVVRGGGRRRKRRQLERPRRGRRRDLDGAERRLRQRDHEHLTSISCPSVSCSPARPAEPRLDAPQASRPRRRTHAPCAPGPPSSAQRGGRESRPPYARPPR